MFKYISDFSNIAHYIINNFVQNKRIAIDATLGNGHDTDFLSQKFNYVYSFEIQKDACNRYLSKNINNVTIINDSHHEFNKYIKSNVDCIVYNLGFLPGGDKSITTMENTTLLSLKTGLDLLNSGGLIIISVYRGHENGLNESKSLEKFLENLCKKCYGVMKHSVINRSNISPLLYVIEKK